MHTSGNCNPSMFLIPITKWETSRMEKIHGVVFYLSSKDGKRIHIGNPDIQKYDAKVGNMDKVSKYEMRPFRMFSMFTENPKETNRPVYVIHMTDNSMIEEYHIENSINIPLEEILKLGLEESLKQYHN